MKALVTIVLALAASAAPAAAATCREVLATNSWTVGTVGSVVAIAGAAVDLGLDRDGALKALEVFCKAHPNTDLGAVIDLLRSLNEHAKRHEIPEIR